mgnify:CR=1 FL=1
METAHKSSSMPNSRLSERARHGMPKKIHQQLITSCLVFPEKKDDEYIYVGEFVRKFSGFFTFWKKRKGLSTKEKLIGNLLK